MLDIPSKRDKKLKINNSESQFTVRPVLNMRTQNIEGRTDETRQCFSGILAQHREG